MSGGGASVGRNGDDSQEGAKVSEATRVAHPLRTPGPLGTLADFERALAYAKQGAIVSDTGLEPEVLEALDAVARAAPTPPKRIIDAAMDAYLHSCAHRSREP
jgi:hypothetical protein